MRLHALTLAACLFFAAPCQSQDAKPELKWDSKFFGFNVSKPVRGRFWVVNGTMAFTDGGRLKDGDEIIKLDGKTVTVEDDLLDMLQKSDGEVKLTAKRMVNGRRKIDTATFALTTAWQAALTPHRRKHDPVNNWDVVHVGAAFDSLKDKTYLLPEFIFKDSHPAEAYLRFQYRSKDWLFIDKLTIIHGDFRTEVKVDRFREAKREVLNGGGIREWFVVSGDEGKAILKAIGESPNESTTIRLHGTDYYRDIELSKIERGSFMLGQQLWKYGQQRKAAEAK